MPPETLLAELQRIAAHVELELRVVTLRRKNAGPGGLCTINGRSVVILNEHTSAIERSTVLADALAGRDLGNVEMPPYVRGFVASRARTRSRILLPERRPGPGLAACTISGRRERRTES